MCLIQDDTHASREPVTTGTVCHSSSYLNGLFAFDMAPMSLPPVPSVPSFPPVPGARQSLHVPADLLTPGSVGTGGMVPIERRWIYVKQAHDAWQMNCQASWRGHCHEHIATVGDSKMSRETFRFGAILMSLFIVNFSQHETYNKPNAGAWEQGFHLSGCCDRPRLLVCKQRSSDF